MTHHDYNDRTTTKRELNKFANYWSQVVQERKDEGTHNSLEKQRAQQYWSHLLRCFGIIPEMIDLYEKNAQRATTGNTGWIDLFISGTVIGEAKSPGKDLDEAQNQIRDYLNGGTIKSTEFPKYSIVTDFENIRITRLDGTEPDVQFHVSDIANHYDQMLFFIAQEPISREEQEQASVKAAKLMAGLYTAVLGDEADTPVGDEAPRTPEEEDEKTEQVSILMTRLLFLMYGDDAGLWEHNLFHRWVEYETTPDSLGGQLAVLFGVLNKPQNKRNKNIPELMAKFPYVNGGIFSQTIEPEFFTPETREALLDACRFRWDHIDVSVFGAMFQLVKSKEARRAAGEHYTSEKDILKTIGPLFYDEYRAEADRLIANKSSRPKDFDAFLNKLASNIYCDPACGGGNFLNVAYARLREIETDILVEKKKRGGDLNMSLDISLDQKLSIDQFYGFEINWWAAKIAETAMFLVDHQANQHLAKELGDAPDRLPIQMAAHIIHSDALALDWRETIPNPAGETFIFGNPPFIGQFTKTSDQTAAMKAVWGKDYDGYLDFVTAWFKKAADYYKHGEDRSQDREGEFAFVSTNSIAQGQAVPALFGPLYRDGWRIKFAYQTFPWNSEAPGKAAVHCIITGFTRDITARQRLFEYNWTNKIHQELKVKTGINAYLLDAPDVLVAKRSMPLSSELPPARFGSKPVDGGNLIVEEKEYAEVSSDPIASKYLRSFRMGRELVRGLDRWCLWLIDLDPQDLAKSKILKSRLEGVKEMRLKSTKAATQELAKTPALFGEIHQPQTDYVGIPRVVSETRNFYTATHYTADIIAADSVYTAEDSDGFLFAVVSSSMFITWQKAVGGRLKSDLRFSNTIVWNNLPLPEVDPKLRAQIIEAGQEVLAARESIAERAGGTRSLADMYNPLAMDKGLLDAHKKLDCVVDKAFGAPKLCTSENQRLEILFDSYAKMTA